MRTGRLLAAWLFMAAAGSAWAQDHLDPDTEAAKRHFETGRKLYNDHDYVRALAEFTTARKLKPLPALDYNIARCHDRLEHYKEALFAYQAFLASKPSSDERADVRERIRVLTERVAEEEKNAARPVEEKKPTPQAPPDEKPAEIHPVEAPPPQAKVETPEPPPPPPRRSLAIPLAVGGAAVVVAAVGTALVLTVGPELDALVKKWNAGPSAALQSQAHGLALRADVGYALWGVAGALAIADVALWIWSLRGRPAEPARAHLQVSPTWGGAVVRGTF